MTTLQLDRGGLDVVRQVTALPRWPETATAAERLSLLFEEARLRDWLVSWAHAFDAEDLQAVMAFFADDCTLVNPRGRFVGQDAIRQNYEQFFQRWTSLRHFWVNVTVRFPHRLDEAYLTGYHYGLNATTDGERKVGHVGTDVWRLTKQSNEWRAIERCLSFDIDHDLVGWTDTPQT